jgi:hypothetical protein
MVLIIYNVLTNPSMVLSFSDDYWIVHELSNPSDDIDDLTRRIPGPSHQDLS